MKHYNKCEISFVCLFFFFVHHFLPLCVSLYVLYSLHSAKIENTTTGDRTCMISTSTYKNCHVTKRWNETQLRFSYQQKYAVNLSRFLFSISIAFFFLCQFSISPFQHILFVFRNCNISTVTEAGHIRSIQH